MPEIAIAEDDDALLAEHDIRATWHARVVKAIAETALPQRPPQHQLAAGVGFLGSSTIFQNEGLLLGGSSGINVAGATRLARALGPGKTIVTVLCDSGTRYQSKLFNPAFLRAKNLPVPPWLAAN